MPSAKASFHPRHLPHRVQQGVSTTAGGTPEDVELRLTRHGYSVRTLSEQFNAKPAEIKRLLRGELEHAPMMSSTDQRE